MLHTFAAGIANYSTQSFSFAMLAKRNCASCAGADGRPLPTTAQVARQQGFARSLARHLTRNQPLDTFSFRDMGSLVALGDYAAYGSLGAHGFLHGGLIKGWLAKVGHASLYRMRQLDLNGFMRGSVGWLAEDLTKVARPPSSSIDRFHSSGRMGPEERPPLSERRRQWQSPCGNGSSEPGS